MKKLSVTEYDYGTGVEIPFDTRFREPFNELTQLEKDVEKFVYDFNVPEGFGQLSPDKQNKFKKYFREVFKQLGEVKYFMQEKPAKLSSLKGMFKHLKRSSYLSFLRKARMNPKFPQEIRRWEAMLKKIEGGIRKHSLSFPPLKGKLEAKLPLVYNSLQNLLNTINI